MYSMIAVTGSACAYDRDYRFLADECGVALLADPGAAAGVTPRRVGSRQAQRQEGEREGSRRRNAPARRQQCGPGARPGRRPPRGREASRGGVSTETLPHTAADTLRGSAPNRRGLRFPDTAERLAAPRQAGGRQRGREEARPGAAPSAPLRLNMRRAVPLRRQLGRPAHAESGEVVRGLVEAAAHGEPVAVPPCSRQAPEARLEEALHLSAVEPRRASAIPHHPPSCLQ